MVRTSMIRARLLSATFVCALFAGSAATLAGQSLRAAPSAAIPAADGGAATEQSGTAGPQLEQRHPRYVIQRQDVLLLSFPLTPELNQTLLYNRMATSICRMPEACTCRGSRFRS